MGYLPKIDMQKVALIFSRGEPQFILNGNWNKIKRIYKILLTLLLLMIL